MIVQMSHFRLLALKQDKKRLMEQLQRFEHVHFKDLMQPEGDDFLTKLPEENVETLIQQRSTIRGLVAEIEQHEKKNRQLVDRSKRRESILRSINVSAMTFEELERRAKEIDIVALLASLDTVEETPTQRKKTKVLYKIIPWESEKLRDEELVEIRDGRAVLGTVAAEEADAFAEELRSSGKVYAIVSREIDGSILFVLKPVEELREHLDILVEKYRLKRRSVGGVRMSWEIMDFRRTIDQMIHKQKRTDGSLARMADYKDSLQIYAEYLENLLLRHEQEKKFLQTDSAILIEGWIPTVHEQAFRQAVEQAGGAPYCLTLEEAPKDSEEVPVRLKNNRIVRPFESLTVMYSMPKYNEIDPTPLFTPFYLFFYGMMLADVGYGLIMLLATGIALKCFDLKEGLANMLRFLFYLSFPVIAWGFVYGSFFCGMIPLSGLVDPHSEYNRVLIMSLVFGFIHLIMGLAIKAYLHIRDGNLLYALFDVGFWYMALTGLLLVLVQGFVPALAVIPTNAIWGVAIAGMVGIVLTNGRDALTPVGKGASGLYSLYGLTNYIGDIISYSRLMALGLAGGSIGLAMNMIIRMMQGSGIVGIVLSVPVFIGIHMFNLFISGLSSYVHAARLTYVEFFSKFYVGSGVTFVPFRAKMT